MPPAPCYPVGGNALTRHPPGWPKGIPPPDVEGWEHEAVVWLVDTGPSHFWPDPFLSTHPVVLARRVVETLEAEVEATRRAWVPLASWDAPDYSPRPMSRC
jgi:hypothetical protein